MVFEFASLSTSRKTDEAAEEAATSDSHGDPIVYVEATSGSTVTHLTRASPKTLPRL